MNRKTIQIAAALMTAVMMAVPVAGAFAGDPVRVAKPLRVAGEAQRVAGQYQLVPMVPKAPAAAGNFAAAPVGPDMQIQSFQFVPTNDKGIRIQVRNAGNQSSSTHELRLTVRRIDGTPVGRTLDAPVPAMGNGDSVWIAVDTSSILPNNVALADTTFRIDADSNDWVQEINENNNRVWHNL